MSSIHTLTTTTKPHCASPAGKQDYAVKGVKILGRGWGAVMSVSLQTAFIHRPLEYGGAPVPDLQYQQPWDYDAGSLTELAAVFGGV